MLPFKLIYDDGYDLNLGPHVFPSHKFRMIRDRLWTEGVAVPDDFLAPDPASDEELLRVHGLGWITKLKQGTLDYLELGKLEIPYSRRMVEAFFLAAGGTILAGRRALADGICINLGGGFHHAYANHGEGFCAIHDVAVAIRAMQAEGLVKKAMVIDCDVHHGNGTASIFAGDATVFTLSIHQFENYPTEKPPSTVDIHLPDGTGDDEYLSKLRGACRAGLAEFRPQLVMFIAGADPYREDQLGGLNLTMEGLKARDRMVFELAREFDAGVAVTLAGGYARNVEDTVTIHCNTVRAAAEVMRAEEDELRAEIRRVFPTEAFHGTVTECPCDECLDMRNNLGGKCWDEIPAAFLDFTRSPTLLEKEAYAYFLPAYLLRSLEDLHENLRDPVTAEFTLYSLCPNEDEVARTAKWRRERAALMTSGQIAVIRRFLRFTASHVQDESREWYSKFVDRALDQVWIG